MRWCGRSDSNRHAHGARHPKCRASTSSATPAHLSNIAAIPFRQAVSACQASAKRMLLYVSYLANAPLKASVAHLPPEPCACKGPVALDRRQGNPEHFARLRIRESEEVLQMHDLAPANIVCL